MSSTFKILFFKLRKSNFVVSILLLFLLFVGFYLIWTPFYYFLFEKYDIIFMPTPNETLMKQPLYEQILLAVIIGPLIETLICQKWMYKLLSAVKWLTKSKISIVVIASIVFGALHCYSLTYIIYNIFIGFLFMVAYISKFYKKAYWTVAVLHGLINLFAIFFDHTEKCIFGIV
ncbi:MAG: CPBP family intramembrane metalloprotease [Bacteroidales bacterium]|jgi:membrane protease YdiL (CAAX protease family)|nr:CPBP family intramembrane metalloprotease [Bacteroidales bacterium]